MATGDAMGGETTVHAGSDPMRKEGWAQRDEVIKTINRLRARGIKRLNIHELR
jgi:hypothetical protein